MSDRPRSRRCPACGLVNRPTVQQCECGQSFDESPEDLRHLLMHRLTIGWMMLVGCGLLLLFSIALVFVIGMFAVFPATACAGAMLKGATMISNARSGLRDLDAKLPVAKVVG